MSNTHYPPDAILIPWAISTFVSVLGILIVVPLAALNGGFSSCPRLFLCAQVFIAIALAGVLFNLIWEAIYGS